MSFPVDTALIPKTTMSSDAISHFENLIEKLKIAREIATANIQVARARSKEYHDPKSEEPNVPLNDRVLIKVSKVQTGLSPKLFGKQDSPYYITEIGPNYTYRLRRCSDHKPIKPLINATRLTLYNDPYIMRDIADELDSEDDSKETGNIGKDNQNNNSESEAKYAPLAEPKKA